MGSRITQFVSLGALSLLALLPIAMVPGLSMEGEVQRGIFAAVIVGGALFVLGVTLLVRREMRYTATPLFLAGIPLAFFAAAVSDFRFLGLYVGTHFEMGTVGSLLLAAIALILCTFLPLQRVRIVLIVSVFSVALYAVIGIASSMASDEVRVEPSSDVTQLIVASAYLDSFSQSFIGTREPYTYAWYRYHPTEINSSPLWSNAPDAPGTALTSIAVRWGLLGALAFLLYLVALVTSACRIYLTGNRSPDALLAHVYAALLGIGVFFLDGDVALFLAFAIAIGCAARLAYGDAIRTIGRVSSIAGGVICVLIAAALLFVSARQFIAAEFIARSSSPEHRADTKAQFLDLAARAWPSPEYHLQASRAAFEHAATLSESGSSNEVIQTALGTATYHAELARGFGYNDFEAAVYHASLFIALLPAGVADAETKVRESLVVAGTIGPNRPEPHYLRAVLAASKGDIAAARASLDAALDLKPDYTEALQLAERLSAPAATVEQVESDEQQETLQEAL